MNRGEEEMEEPEEELPLDLTSQKHVRNVVVEELCSSVREEAMDLTVGAAYARNASRPPRRLNRVEAPVFNDPRTTLPNRNVRHVQTQTEDGSSPAMQPVPKGVGDNGNKGAVPPQADTNGEDVNLPLAPAQANTSGNVADLLMESVQAVPERGGVSKEGDNVSAIKVDINAFCPRTRIQNVVSTQLEQEEASCDMEKRFEDGSLPPGSVAQKTKAAVPAEADIDKETVTFRDDPTNESTSGNVADSKKKFVQCVQKGGRMGNATVILTDVENPPCAIIPSNCDEDVAGSHEEIRREVLEVDGLLEEVAAVQAITDKNEDGETSILAPGEASVSENVATCQEVIVQGRSERVGTSEDAATVPAQDDVGLDIVYPPPVPVSFNIAENVSGSLENLGHVVLERGILLEEQTAVPVKADIDEKCETSTIDSAQAVNSDNVAAFQEEIGQSNRESFGHFEETVVTEADVGRATVYPWSNCETAPVSPADSEASVVEFHTVEMVNIGSECEDDIQEIPQNHLNQDHPTDQVIDQTAAIDRNEENSSVMEVNSDAPNVASTSRNHCKNVKERKGGKKRKDRACKKTMSKVNVVQPTSRTNNNSFWFNKKFYRSDTELPKNLTPYVNLNRVSPPQLAPKDAPKKVPEAKVLTTKDRFKRIMATVGSIFDTKRSSVTNSENTVPKDGSLPESKHCGSNQKIKVISGGPAKTNSALTKPTSASKPNQPPPKMSTNTTKITLRDIDWSQVDSGNFDPTRKIDWKGVRIPKIKQRKTILISPLWLKPKKSPKRRRKNKHQNVAVETTPMSSPVSGWEVSPEISVAQAGGGDATTPRDAKLISETTNHAVLYAPDSVGSIESVLDVEQINERFQEEEQETFVTDALVPDSNVAPASNTGGNPATQVVSEETGVNVEIPVQRMAESSPSVVVPTRLLSVSKVKDARKKGIAFGWNPDTSVNREKNLEERESPTFSDMPIKRRLQTQSPDITEGHFDPENKPERENEEKQEEIERVTLRKRGRPPKQKTEKNVSNKTGGTSKGGPKKAKGSPKAEGEKDTAAKFKCPHCPKDFIRKDNMNNHIAIFHKTKHFWRVCELCEYETLDNDEIFEHIWDCNKRLDPEIAAKHRVEWR